MNDKISVLPILLKYDEKNTDTEEKHLVYIVKDNVALPVLITHTTVIDKRGVMHVETICRNLNDGTLLDYAHINTVQ